MKTIFTLLLICCSTLSFAQKTVIDQARLLMEQKKYESAIRVLDEADPHNDHPDIVIEKTELFLKYFVTSIMHEMFALKDLEPNEELMDIRGSEGSFSMFVFRVDSVINRLINKNPSHYGLNKTLGYYYHEVHLKYGQNWLLPDSIVVKKFHDNYLIAYEKKVYDYWSLYGIGYAKLLMNDYLNAVPYFEKSIELKEDFPSGHYNLGLSYLNLDERDKAIKSGVRALNLYEIPYYKADAARMVGVTYQELNQNEKALEYFLIADKIMPNDYYTLKSLVDMEVKLGKSSYVATTQRYFHLQPDNPLVYQDIISIFWSNNRQSELLGFFEKQIAANTSNKSVLGNIYFYIAVVHFHSHDDELSKINFNKSRDVFSNVYESDHEVFMAIESYLDEIEK